jgi:quercetin dioxygenase-like cupin family protein
MRNRVIDLWGEPIEVMIGSEATNNASCTVIQTSPPGGGTPIHVHSREDEVLVVLDGDYAYYDGDTWHAMQPGQPRYLVRGRAHAYRNIGKTPGRMMVFAAPGGLDLYFAAIAPLSLPHDQARFDDISAMFGITVPPPDAAPPISL